MLNDSNPRKGSFCSRGRAVTVVVGPEEVAAIRAQAASASEVISKVARVGWSAPVDAGQVKEHSTSFEEKTGFSKAKWLKRKRRKYVRTVRVVHPTAMGLGETFYNKHKVRIQWVPTPNFADGVDTYGWTRYRE